jgi:PAS domain S-box-containing protein
LSAAVVATAVAVLVGWWRDIPALKSVFPGFITMKVNAALALAFTGVALWFYRIRNGSKGRDTAFTYCASAAVLIALLTLVEHLTGWNLRIDQLIFTDTEASAAPGRMDSPTAVCLLLVNVAMLVAVRPGRYGTAQALVAGAILLSTLNGVSFFFGLESFGGMASYGTMAVHAAVCVLLVALGILFTRPVEGLMNAAIDVGAGGLAIRQLVPVVFILPVLLAWLSWQGVRLGWYGPGFAMAVFVALTTNVLSYAVWGGGWVLRNFDQKRQAAEAERVRSEERLRRAVVDAPVPIVIHDDEGRILHMSRGWSQYSGYRLADTATIAAWIEAARPTGITPMALYLERVSMATETVHGGEWTIATSSGTERIWEFSSTPLGSPGSPHHAVVTMAVDITERKNAEADLRRANEGLEQRIEARTKELTTANDALKRQSDQLKEQATLLDLVRDGILARDLYGTIIYWSEGASDLYGWKKPEALGSVSHQLLRAEYPKPRKEIEKEVINTGYWEGEVVHTTKSGGRLSVESRWTLTRTERGTPQGFLEVNRDISARKLAQQSLRDSELRFRSVAETAIEGIISMDERGTISYWNPGAERMFGRTAAEAIGHPSAIALPDGVLSAYDAAGGDQAIGRTIDTTGRRRDGSTFPVELSLSAWVNAHGARVFTGIARDITERKNAERALQAKAEELARSNQELEQFAYVASHDLQEPLRMVSNYTQLLARRYKDKLDADANEFIDFAVDGAKRMQDLIRDLLEFARVGTRGKEFKPAPLERIVRDALANLSDPIDEAQAEIVIEPLPTVACDASQLGHVFQNLIGNAIKFRRPGDRPVVHISAARSDQAWVLSVRDNGIGIDPKYFERIFQMFQRLHGRGEYSGTGIGLALCKKIIERHGGRITVESAPDQGSTFSFTIPDSTVTSAEREKALTHEAY